MSSTNLRVARRFLGVVWTPQPPAGQYAYLAQKESDGSWHDYPISRAEVIHLPDSTDNLYFAPSLFTDQRRLRKFAAPGRWLYADLDEVAPVQLEELGVPATIVWETSPGRYQCLWHLRTPLSPKALARLNQKMTYYVGADHNGWSLTKVLRVPGTVSTKHDAPFTVRVVARASRASYEPRKLAQLVRDVQTPADLQNARTLRLPSASRRALLRKHPLSARTKKLLKTKTPTAADDRSARLWELCRLLLERGYTAEETFVLVRPTVWNKWEDDERLWLDVQKAAAQPRKYPKRDNAKKRKPAPDIELGEVATDELTDEPPAMLPYLPMHKFMAQDHVPPKWLVEGVWVDGAYGWWAGEYKAFKTMTLLDFAISVASGKPFLGHYDVHTSGRVLYLYEEGQKPAIWNRLNNIHHSRGLGGSVSRNGNGRITARFPERLPLDIFNRTAFRELSGSSFSLSDPTSRSSLEEYIRLRKPRVIILEAFYLVTGDLDESSSADVIPILRYLEQLNSANPGLNIVVSHHYNKSTEERSRSTARISGSGALLRWYESAVELERFGEEADNTAHFKATHRDAEALPRVTLQFAFEGRDSYDVSVLTDDNDNDPTDKENLDDVLDSFPKGATLAELETATELNRQHIRRLAKVHRYPVRKERRNGRLQVIIYPRPHKAAPAE